MNERRRKPGLSLVAIRLTLAGLIGFAGLGHSSSDINLDFVVRGQSRLRQSQAKNRKTTDNLDFVVLDLETTGFSAERDEIIEVAMIRVQFSDAGIQQTEWQSLVKPFAPIPKKIREITQITNEMVSDAPRLLSILPEVQAFIGDASIVAHNARFDSRMLERAATQMGISFCENEWICSMDTAKNGFPGLTSYKLASLVSHFNIEAGQSHRALNDARATLALFVHCLDNCAVPGIVQVKKDGFNKFNNTNESEFDEPQYSANLEREIIVFSGFRDVILAARIEQTGGTIVPGIRKDVTRLLVLNASASPTGKVKKALQYNIPVQSKKEFEDSFYISIN